MNHDFEIRMAAEAGRWGDVARLQKRYSEDQPRDDKGRFGSSGAENAKTSEEHQAAVNYHDAKAQEYGDKGDTAKSEAHAEAATAHDDAAHAMKSQSGGYKEAALKSDYANKLSAYAHGKTSSKPNNPNEV